MKAPYFGFFEWSVQALCSTSRAGSTKCNDGVILDKNAFWATSAFCTKTILVSKWSKNSQNDGSYIKNLQEQKDTIPFYVWEVKSTEICFFGWIGLSSCHAPYEFSYTLIFNVSETANVKRECVYSIPLSVIQPTPAYKRWMTIAQAYWVEAVLEQTSSAVLELCLLWYQPLLAPQLSWLQQLTEPFWRALYISLKNIPENTSSVPWYIFVI